MSRTVEILADQPQRDLEDFASFLTPEQQRVFWAQIAVRRGAQQSAV